MSSSSTRQLSLERLSHIGPVTALAFTPDNSNLLYGSGPSVSNYSITEDREVCRRNIFSRNRVHGIKLEVLPDDILVLLWGATSFTYISLTEFFKEASSEAIPELVASDWILDARLLGSTTIVLVTAHGSLLVHSLKTGKFLRRYNCEEQSLLYAAQIYLTNDKEIIVATGTVFNEIQLWRLLANSVSEESDTISQVPIGHRLRGHEGCIFSLRFNYEGTLLASCSDDRTIRVWDVRQGTYVAIGFGHIARVWDIRFLPSFSDSEDEIYLLSSSEDTSAILWHLKTSDRTLTVQEQYHGHGGKHVWSQAISYDGTMAVTGGNDGGVSIWDIGGWRDRIGSPTSDVYWKEPSQCVTVNGKDKVDLIKGYRCLDHDNLLMSTGSGRMFLYNLSTKKWTLLAQKAQYKNYATIATFEGMNGLVCLGDSKGRAELYYLGVRDEAFEWAALDVLIVGIFTAIHKETSHLYVLAHGSQTSLSVISMKPNGVFSLVSVTSLELPFGFEPTAFLADVDNGVFFLGSRQGALACYETRSGHLIGVWRHIHDREGVRGLQIHRSCYNTARCTEILTTGRNWAYQILKIILPQHLEGTLPTDVVSDSIEGVEMRCVHRSNLNRAWLEGSATINSNLLLWGFQAKKFAFWNETTGELIFEHQCGGANRIWDFYIPSHLETDDIDRVIRQCWLVYTSKANLHFRRVGDRILQKSVRKANHGREIRCLAMRQSSSGDIILASGSEDTYINFTEVLDDSLNCIHRKKQCNTGVQALVFSENGRFMFSSAGQKAVNVSPLRIGGHDIVSVEFGGFSNTTDTVGTENGRDDQQGGDLRVMGIDVRNQTMEGLDGYAVAIVLSDSTVKVQLKLSLADVCYIGSILRQQTTTSLL